MTNKEKFHKDIRIYFIQDCLTRLNLCWIRLNTIWTNRHKIYTTPLDILEVEYE